MDLTAISWWLIGGVFAAGYIIGRFARPTDEELAARGAPVDPRELLGNLSDEARTDIDRMLAEKKTIVAIRRLREDIGAGLRDAKLAVDECRRAGKSG